MNSTFKSSFSYEKNNTEPNKNLILEKTRSNGINYKSYLNNQIKNRHKKNKSINYNDISTSNYLENNSVFFNPEKEKILFHKNNQNVSNKSTNLFENTEILNYTYKKINLKKKGKSPLIYDAKNNDNSFNLNLTSGYNIKNILNNKNRNNKLKMKFENLLDLAMKNYNDKKKINKLENVVEAGKMAKMEMTIERIRNKNRKQIFKKQMELALFCKRKKNNTNINLIKEKLNKKLIGKLNDSNLYKSTTNFINYDLYNNKRNTSFKRSFTHLNSEINNNNQFLKKYSSSKLMLNSQNIYKPNSKLDYNKKTSENEKNGIYSGNSNMKFKNRLKFLKTDLKFF